MRAAATIRKTALTASLATLLMASLGACTTSMLDSETIPTALDGLGPTTCHSNAGAYHLPRRLMTAKVKMGADNKSYSIEVNTGAPKYVADRNETYCLDFLLSGFAVDRVGVQRDEQLLLQRIYTKAEDKSTEIALKAVEGITDLISSEKAGSLMRAAREAQFIDGAGYIATFEFDPFVEREAREVNLALSEFGYCLFLDPTNDPFVPQWSQRICVEISQQRKVRVAGKQTTGAAVPAPVLKAPPYPRSGLRHFDPNPVSKEWQSRGVLYRPDLSHSLMVVRQKDPGSGNSPWLLAASERVTMPNAAPAFVLEAKRATFVTAETDIQFSNGQIKNISIIKPSELLAASHLAVAVAQVVVNIPKRSFDIFSNRADNTEALIKANTDLIAVLREHGTDADAQAAAREELTGGRSTGGLRTNGRSSGVFGTSAASRVAECMRNPAMQQAGEDVRRTCQDYVSRRL